MRLLPSRIAPVLKRALGRSPEVAKNCNTALHPPCARSRSPSHGFLTARARPSPMHPLPVQGGAIMSEMLRWLWRDCPRPDDPKKNSNRTLFVPARPDDQLVAANDQGCDRLRCRNQRIVFLPVRERTVPGAVDGLPMDQRIADRGTPLDCDWDPGKRLGK